jgi:polyferredoxin
VSRFLGHLRYAVLAVFVVILPLFVLNRMGYGAPWFCQAVCPAGTLEAGGLFFLMPELREQIGGVFALKLGLLAGVLGWAVVSYRPYCRTVCPLGAIYGLFNRWSLLRVEHDPALCRDCRSCVENCEVELDPRRAGPSPVCLRCFGCALHHCPTGALSVRVGSVRLAGQSCDQPSTPTS